MIHEVPLAAGSCSVWDSGESSRSVPVVLLHGFAGSGESWAGVRERLAERYRVVALDLPGHGATPEGCDAAGYTMEAAADRVERVLAWLHIERAALAGYSMGGRLALYVAVTRPARVGSLVLESASAGLQDPPARFERRSQDERRAELLESDGIETFVDRWENMPLFASQRRLDPSMRAALRRERLACDPRELAANLRGMGLGSQPWLGPWLGELDIPVLLVTGGADTKFTGIAADLERRMPRARLVVVAGAGHNVHLEKGPEFAAAVLDFLQER